MSDISVLQAWLADAPRRHHVESCLCPLQSSGQAPEEPNEGTDVDRVRKASDYATCFKTAFEKAKKRVEPGQLLPVTSRASQHMAAHPSNTAATPWLKSQIDVYEMIVNSLRDKHAQSSDAHALADVGQSSYRGAVCTQGTLPSISTSTRIFSFKLKRSSPQRNACAVFSHH
jgi:hypothetical protein